MVTVAGIEHSLHELVEAHTPTQIDVDRREEIIERVGSVALRALKHLRYKDLQVIPYGSYVSGMYRSNRSG